MFNPFMTVTHCARFATRQAFRTGDVHHVVATWDATKPLAVIDDHELLQFGEQLTIKDLLFTADPFSEAQAS